MIPADWVPVRRSSDRETIGYLEMVGDDVVPRGLVGNALADPMADWDDAERVVSELGMQQLGRTWVLATDGIELTVVILEIDPVRAVVGDAAQALVVGRPKEDAWRREVEVPTDVLRPA